MQLHLLRRLKKLEEAIPPLQPQTIRYRFVRPLPKDYVGERHFIEENIQETAPGFEMCDLVEYPGPAPGSPGRVG
jgi:hypothetical protein